MDRTRFRFAFLSALGGSALGLAALCLGCGPTAEEVANGDDPLRALESSAHSTVYDAAYWGEQARSASALWTQAIEKCGDPEWSSAPNCAVVREQQAAAEAEAGAEEAEGTDDTAPADQPGEDVAPEDEHDSEATAEEPNGAAEPEPQGQESEDHGDSDPH